SRGRKRCALEPLRTPTGIAALPARAAGRRADRRARAGVDRTRDEVVERVALLARTTLATADRRRRPARLRGVDAPASAAESIGRADSAVGTDRVTRGCCGGGAAGRD